MKLILAGFGTVGQGLTAILRDKGAMLRQRYGFAAQIVGVVTGSRGSLYRPDGLDLSQLIIAAGKGNFAHYPESDGLRRDFGDATAMIAAGQADVLVEASPTNLESAQPALTYFEAALSRGMHIVTANKGPVAIAYNSLMEQAKSAGVQLRYEATVMAGTPAIATGIELLAGCDIHEVRGIFNGTTNYMLTQMESGLTYAQALQQAQELGYAETDPTADVEGWDAAAKVMILSAALFGKPLSRAQVDVTGITGITPANIEAAHAAGERIKLIGRVTPDGGQVKPQRVPLTDPLAHIGGATNAITFRTDLMGEITLSGAGAGKAETGFALLADLLAIERMNKS